MGKEKIGGVAETMLQTLYARAKESQKPNRKIYDDKAIEIVEGLSMYLSADDVRRILSIINHRFSHATVFMEILNPVFIKKNVEKSISQSGAVFTWGAKSGEDLIRLAPEFSWQGDRSLVEGMIEIAPIYKVIGKIAAIRNLSNKITVLKK